MRAYDDFVLAVRKRLEQENISVRAAALRADLPIRSVQGILEGHVPSIDRAAAIADALGICFRIGPPHGHSGDVSTAAPILDRFAADMDMLARGYATCSLVGYLEKEKEYHEPPAPMGIREVDADSFYVVAKGTSMIPEGIREGDYCLVSPNTPVAAGLRVWLKDRRKKACIKRLVSESDTTYHLRGWDAPRLGRQQNHNIAWLKTDTVERGAILAVYRGRPDAAKPPPLIPDPKAPVADAPAPRAIADLLDLPANANMAQAVEKIEACLKDAGGLNEVAAVVKAETESLRRDMAARFDALTDDAAMARPTDDTALSPVRPVDIVELDAAAGGAEAFSEKVAGRVWFRRGWLDEYGLDPNRCAVIGVRGESMEPLLPDGCSILVDRARAAWRTGGIFVLRTPHDGLIVKRAGADDDGNPILISAHPKWEPVPLPDDAEIIGQVVWTARTLVGENG